VASIVIPKKGRYELGNQPTLLYPVLLLYFGYDHKEVAMTERLGRHNGPKSSLDGIASLLVALIGPAGCVLKIMIKGIRMNNDHTRQGGGR
jgi:hypothetical protein